MAAGSPYLALASVPEPLDANAKPAVLTMAEQKELKKLRAQDQRELKALKKSCSARRWPWRRRRHCVEQLRVLRKQWDCPLLRRSLRLQPGGRGRLTSAAQRRKVVELIGEANAAGAGLVSTWVEIGIDLHTLKRCWKALAGDGNGQERRQGSPRHVVHWLSEEERQRILLTCNQPEFTLLPPGQDRASPG